MSARDESAEHANEIIRVLEPIITSGDLADSELRAVAQAINAAHKIARLLEREGAPTIPTR